jgi:PleD family two-component response regulator
MFLQRRQSEWSVKPIPFTVSIGVVTRQAGEDSVDTLMRRADRALYEAKAAVETEFRTRC